MQHCTPEQLALAALREPLPADDSAHLATCEACRSEVASLQRAVDAVAVPQLAAPGPAVAPPPAVWDAIVAATGVSATVRDDVVADPPAAEPVRAATVLPFRPRRRPALLVAAAVLAGAVVGAGAVAVVQNGDDGEAVTAVALDPLADNEASGRAEVVELEDGSRVVRVELDAPALDAEYYEIWLIDRDVVDMVPLGVVRPGTQTVELPADLDLGRFPLVDVSVEPLDGDPTHSGVSVARGELDT
ncbi:anti-sigma factor [Blastococcus haudaquaticus]|uniref:Anti-sigma-K factor rskA n=1 Tax=Blastococcus haudaquaticus TaxID=1938745 RepID=A0A286GXW8_9ACTN|nr:anti-sigma factor [Blastococcus haudaquaticus]SOE00026.1 Anti-sigma-K factor rskA [Blastococcus haudaquaticus]